MLKGIQYSMFNGEETQLLKTRLGWDGAVGVNVLLLNTKRCKRILKIIPKVTKQLKSE